MDLPTKPRLFCLDVPPLHGWPRPLKQLVWSVALLLVFSAYFALLGGLIFLVVIIARFGGS